MIKKYLIMPIALAAAGGIPYIAVNDDFSTQVQQAYDGITAKEEDTSLGDLSDVGAFGKFSEVGPFDHLEAHLGSFRSRI